MDYLKKHEEELNKLRKDGFEEIATLWRHKDDPNRFAFAEQPLDGEMPDMGVYMDALLTILEQFEEQFNSTSYDFGTHKITWYTGDDEDTEIPDDQQPSIH